MGVEYFDCPRCGESICDCGEYYNCSCGKSFCIDCCSQLDEKGFKREDHEYPECVFCTNKAEHREVTDEEFIEWLREVTQKTKKDYIQHLIDEGQLTSHSSANLESDDEPNTKRQRSIN